MGSLTLALPIWTLSIANGMMGTPSNRAEVFGDFFGVYLIMLGALLAPALIGLLKRAEPGKGVLK